MTHAANRPLPTRNPKALWLLAMVLALVWLAG